MIILSQDKKVLFPFKETIYLNGSNIYGGNDESYCLLGNYKDELRAKEVLYKIADAYYHCNRAYKMPEE